LCLTFHCTSIFIIKMFITKLHTEVLLCCLLVLL